MTAVVEKKITRDDLEAKFREVQGEVDEAGDQAKSYAVAAGVVLVVLAVGVAWFLGRRRGKSQRTVVEIRRV
jgi:hypothetical protein